MTFTSKLPLIVTLHKLQKVATQSKWLNLATGYVQGAAKKYPPKIFFAVFSASLWNFKAKFYQLI